MSNVTQRRRGGPAGRWRALLAIAGTLMLGVHLSSAQAAEVAAQRCVAVASTDFSMVEDAATEVTSANVIAAEGRTPAYCDVQGYVSPSVGFALRLPLEKWNGKFVMIGCGGWCGLTKWSIEQCYPSLRRGYACVATDMGHGGGNLLDSKWAYNNLPALIDFVSRGTHVAVLAGKAITESFYHSAPARSYYMGCSQGGRQGLMSAQRFPEDFDGIVVGAPGGVAGTERGPLQILWAIQALHDSKGDDLFTKSDIDLLTHAAVARCDADDGVRDGVISNPRKCGFKPRELLCKAGKTPECLTEAQVLAAQKVYDGPKTSSGRPLSTGGSEIGSEYNWPVQFMGPPLTHKMILDPFRYLFLYPAPGPSWDPLTFNFDHDTARTNTIASLYATTNPDLREFKARGGKLIYFHGWNDAGLPPSSAIDYYQMVTRAMGGHEETDSFFRLFMVPGMDHCTGGTGAYAVDFLGAVDQWVEHDHAPDKLLAVRPKGPEVRSLIFKDVELPLAPQDVVFTRPLFPYPKRAVYSGKGDPNSADSFVAAPN